MSNFYERQADTFEKVIEQFLLQQDDELPLIEAVCNYRALKEQHQRVCQEDDAFVEHLKDAQRIVDSWPEWKRNVLVASSSPEVNKPREHIMGFGGVR